MGLRSLAWDVVDGVANYLLCHIPAEGPDARDLVERCREQHLFLRNASPMGRTLGDRAVRVAVKDAGTNARMLAILQDVSRTHSRNGP